MKPDTIDPRVPEDRLATSDEIRAAALRFTDTIEDGEILGEILGEIAADFGGYVRISAVEIETTVLVEELTKEQERDTWLN